MTFQNGDWFWNNSQLLCCIYSTGQINIFTFHTSCSMQPENVLAQILNEQHSKSGTLQGQEPRWWSEILPLCPLVYKHSNTERTAAWGRPPDQEMKDTGEEDVQVTISFFPKCTKDNCWTESKTPLCSWAKPGEGEQNGKSYNHLLLSLRGMCKSVCECKGEAAIFWE